MVELNSTHSSRKGHFSYLSTENLFGTGLHLLALVAGSRSCCVQFARIITSSYQIDDNEREVWAQYGESAGPVDSVRFALIVSIFSVDGLWVD